MNPIRLTTIAAAFVAWVLLVAPTSHVQAQQSGEESRGGVLEEIMVTAQRREQALTDVPVSITALGRDEADKRGVLNIEDVARITPNLTLANFGNTIQRISIRGVDSDAGAGTTGIYINDVPIQVRQIGFNAFDVFPLVFDLERVEVLRGPQGTLFGAGSQGGTIRFITPEPDLSESSGYSRVSIGNTENGATGWEAGAAYGGPIVEDKIAWRGSIRFAERAGWIDRVTEPPSALGTLELIDEDANSIESTIARLDVKFAVSDAMEITPSIYYQNQDFNDSSVFWVEDTGPTALSSSFVGAYSAPLQFSDVSGGKLRGGENTQQKGEDEFVLSSIKVQYDWESMRLVGIASQFDREQTLADDFTTFDQVLFTGIVNGPAIANVSPFGFSRPVLPGQWASSFDINEQKNTTLEVRLEGSTDALDWVAGVFYTDREQTAVQQVQDLFLGTVLDQQFQDLLGFGLGPDPILGFFGIPLVDGLYIFDNLEVAKDKALAGFAQVDWKVTDSVTLTGGVRVSDVEYNIFNEVVGPVLGPFTTDFVEQSETPVTPKVAVSWRPDEEQNHLLYASASKGFRIGGANAAVGLPCGVTDGAPVPGTALGILGLSDRPLGFDSDDLWNYEIGSKSTFLDGSLQANFSLFMIDWKDIQQNLQLPACGFRYFDNVGSAEITGIELEASWAATDNLYLALAIGYADAEFTETVFATPEAEAGGALPVLSDGDKLGAPPFTLNFAGQYNFAGPFETDYYVRVDYDHTRGPDDLPAMNSANGSFDPNFTPNPDTDFVNFRFAAQIREGSEIALVVNNLFDELPELNRAVQPNGTLWRAQSFRPRTIGLQGIFRF